MKSMTSKVIEGHKGSSNFSVNPTLPLMISPTLCEQFSARFPLKERGARRFPLLRFDLIFGYGSIPIIPTFFA